MAAPALQALLALNVVMVLAVRLVLLVHTARVTEETDKHILA